MNNTKDYYSLAIVNTYTGQSRCKGQIISKANYGFLNSSKKPTKLTIMSREDAQDSEFHSFLGRIEDTINWFQNLLPFNFGRHKFVFEEF